MKPVDMSASVRSHSLSQLNACAQLLHPINSRQASALLLVGQPRLGNFGARLPDRREPDVQYDSKQELPVDARCEMRDRAVLGAGHIAAY